MLIVTGELDTATGVNPGDAWAECFPNGRHLTIPGSGHNPWVDQPEIFAHLVTEFLSRNETRSGSSSDAVGV